MSFDLFVGPRHRRRRPGGPPARTVLSAQVEAGFKVQLDVIAAA